MNKAQRKELNDKYNALTRFENLNCALCKERKSLWVLSHISNEDKRLACLNCLTKGQAA